MNVDISSVRDVWNSIFDYSLENFAKENVQFRNLAMVLHILQLEFKKTKVNYLELQRKSERQAKEIHDYEKKLSESPQLLMCKKPSRSPLKHLSANETTPSKIKQEISIFEDEEDADIFNYHLNEADLSKENDDSLFIDNSLEDFETPKSPTLNKSRKVRSVKKTKRNLTISQSADYSVIMGTPVKVVKNLKQSKLSSCYSGISKLINSVSTKNNNVTKSSVSNNNQSNSTAKLDESDETLCFAAQKSPYCKKETDEQVDIDVIIKELNNDGQNKNKKLKLDDSYDRVPEQRSTSPEYAYKREAVRKKDERLKLQGWACADCEKYYTKFNHLSDEELKKRMDMCSRHRSKFNPNILTPKGFWDLDFPPTQESLRFDV